MHGSSFVSTSCRSKPVIKNHLLTCHITPCFNIFESTSYHRWVNSTYQKRTSDLLKQRKAGEGFPTFINHTWRWLSIHVTSSFTQEKAKKKHVPQWCIPWPVKKHAPTGTNNTLQGTQKIAYSTVTINYSSTWNTKRKKHIVSQQKNA